MPSFGEPIPGQLALGREGVKEIGFCQHSRQQV
jgi:hypothetical protein